MYGLSLEGASFGLESPGLGLEGAGFGLESPGLGLESPGLVNIPGRWHANHSPNNSSLCPFKLLLLVQHVDYM